MATHSLETRRDEEMKERGPSIEEWKELYDAVLEFKGMGRWDWMKGSDMFGVQNPTTGEIGYCSIIGETEDGFAVEVYLGAEGYEGFMKMYEGNRSRQKTDRIFLLRCLIASFGEESIFEKEDMKIIKTLGLKLRGRNSLPNFRSFRPGFMPWFLTSEEAEYLTHALREALGVCLRSKEDPGVLSPPGKGLLLVRVPTKGECGLSWRDEWLEPERMKRVEATPVKVDEGRLEAIRSSTFPRRGIWEVDVFYSIFSVGKKGERPRLPFLALVVEHNSGQLLGQMRARSDDHRQEFLEHFLSLVEDTKLLPGAVMVKKDEVVELMEPIASMLGIEVIKAGKLPAMEGAKMGIPDLL